MAASEKWRICDIGMILFRQGTAGILLRNPGNLSIIKSVCVRHVQIQIGR